MPSIAVLGNAMLDEFTPDIIYIHTSNRNISRYPNINDLESDIAAMLCKKYSHYESMWNSIQQKYL